MVAREHLSVEVGIRLRRGPRSTASKVGLRFTSPGPAPPAGGAVARGQARLRRRRGGKPGGRRGPPQDARADIARRVAGCRGKRPPKASTEPVGANGVRAVDSAAWRTRCSRKNRAPCAGGRPSPRTVTGWKKWQRPRGGVVPGGGGRGGSAVRADPDHLRAVRGAGCYRRAGTGRWPSPTPGRAGGPCSPGSHQVGPTLGGGAGRLSGTAAEHSSDVGVRAKNARTKETARNRSRRW